MEYKDIMNFSNFFGVELTPKKLNKEDFSDFFIKEGEKKEEVSDYPQEIEIEEPDLDDAFNPPVNPEKFTDFESPKEIEIEDSLPEPKYEIQESKDNYYTLYNDKSEDFRCDVYVEGAKINETRARLVLETNDWNLMFEGDIDKYGKCSIPIKKLNILSEGTIGKIRLEVIAENTVFTPWEDDFKVRMSKKVMVQVHENKKTAKKPVVNESSVRVNIRK